MSEFRNLSKGRKTIAGFVVTVFAIVGIVAMITLLSFCGAVMAP